MQWFQMKPLLSQNSLLEPMREDLGVLILDKGLCWDFEDGIEFFQRKTFRCRCIQKEVLSEGFPFVRCKEED